MATVRGDHGGTCGHCGGAVRPGFQTCQGCGAMWKLMPSFSSNICGLLALGLGVVGVFMVWVGLEMAPDPDHTARTALFVGVVSLAGAAGLFKISAQRLRWLWMR